MLSANTYQIPKKIVYFNSNNHLQTHNASENISVYTHFSKYFSKYFQLNDFELRKGKKLGVTISFNNHRLFVGNIPKNRDTEELLEEFSKHAREYHRWAKGYFSS